MLLNDFYTLHQIDRLDNGFTALIRINKEHRIFEGHFPGQPVVPGVCMIQITKELIAQQAGIPLLLTKGNQLKFLQLIDPTVNSQLQVSANWEIIDNNYVASASWTSEHKTVFKFQGVFQRQG